MKKQKFYQDWEKYMNKSIIYLALLALLALLSTMSCSKKDQTCSKIEKDGIITYVNKNIPADTTVKIVLSEEKVLTTNSSYEIRFPVNVNSDSKGNIYILCLDNDLQIVKLDSTLRFITAFGKKGNGPGEVTEPERINIEHDTIVVFDNRSMRSALFNTDGKFIKFRTYTTTVYPSKSFLLSTNQYFSFFLNFNTSTYQFEGYELNIADRAVNITKNILKVKTTSLKKFPVLAVSNKTIAISEYNEDRFCINLYNHQGVLKETITKSYAKIPILYKKDKRQKYFESKYKRATYDIQFLKEKLLVFTANKDNEQKEDSVLSVDIFDKGIFQNNVKLHLKHLFDPTWYFVEYKIIGNKLFCFDRRNNFIFIYKIEIL